ncbi:MAG: PAS domain S-box protein [Bacteroidia bacterium]|nr:PAS domain S-box protein [Bacteroidia bacterium]
MSLKTKTPLRSKNGKQALVRKSSPTNGQAKRSVKTIAVNKKSNSVVKQTTADNFFNNLKIIEDLPSGFILFDEKKIHLINKKAAQAFGLSKVQKENPATLSLYDFIHTDSKKLLKRNCKSSAVGECVFRVLVKTKKTAELPAEIKLAETNLNGKKVYAALMCEASDKIKLEEELETYRNDFNLILSCIDEVVYYVDQTTGVKGKRVKYISDHIRNIIGVDKNAYEAKSKQLLEYCHPDDVPQIIEVAEKLKKEKNPIKFSYRFKHLQNGKYIWLEERIFPQFNKKKEHIGNFGVSRDVTKEKNFEQKLMESEARFRLLAENANDIIYKCNYFPEAQYEYISPSVKKILGYSPAEFYKNAAFGMSIMHPDDLSDIDFRGEDENSEQPVTKTSRYFHKNGNMVWLETSYSFFRDEKGKILAIQGISRDVTKEKEAELKVEENERKFRLLAENAHDIIFHYKFLDEPGYTFMSHSVIKILGYTPEEFYKDPFLGYKILYPEDRPILGDSETNTREKHPVSKEVPETTLRYLAKDGRIVWLQTTYSQVRDKEGRVVELEGISRDITKQKESDLALFESERKINSLLGNLPGMAYRCQYNESWTMLFVSHGSEELTGYLPAEFLNNAAIPFSAIVHPEDILRGRPEIEKAIKSKTTFEIEYRIINKSGEIKWVWEKGEGVYNQSGQLLFIEGFITDISQRKKFEVELNQKWTNFQSLVDTSPDGIFILQHARVAYANPAALRIMEIDNMEAATKINVLDLILPEYHSLVRERIERTVAGENFDFYHEYKVHTVKGKLLEIEVRSIPIIFNQKFALQIIFHDLTAHKQLEHQQIRAQLAEEANIKLQEEIYERKRIESELRQTQKFTRLLIDSSLDMICAADRDGKIIEFNYAAQSAFGYSFEEAYGKPLTMLYANVKERTGILSQMVDNETPFSGEVINKRRNGETFISYLSATILKDENGELIGSMGVSRDITKLKMDELLLRENEERYRAIYNQAFIGIARVDIYSGKFIEVNLRLCEILGYTKEELLRKTTFEITVKDDHDKLSLSDQLSGDGFFVQRRYVHKNGSVVYMNLSYSLVKDVTNNPLYFVVVYDDITRNKIYEQEILSQSSKLKAIFESSSHLVWTVNRNYEITSYNSNFADVIKEKFKISPTLNRKLQDYLSTTDALEYSKDWITKYESVFAGNKLKFEKADHTGRGEEVFREVFLHPIYNEKNRVVEIACIAHDITERKFFERQITEQSAKLNAIFESTTHMIWTMNRNLELTSFNQNYSDESERLFKFKPTLNQNMAEAMSGTVQHAEMEFWAEKFTKVFEGERQQFEMVTEGMQEDEKICREIYLHPIFNEKKEVVEVSGIAQDITERKKYEKQIVEQSAQLKAIFNSSSHLIWTVNKDLVVTSYNDNFYERISNNKESFHILKKGKGHINPNNPSYGMWLNNYEKAFKGQSQHFETHTTNTSDEPLWTEIFLEPIIGIEGNVIEVSGIAHDITEKKMAEGQLKLSLKEKEVLLKEVHHRVKNNLQVISSILNLQSSYVKDQKTLNLLKECQNRIKSMAFIHESLYQNKDFSAINFSEYLVMLSNNLLHSYGLIENRIKLVLDVEQVALNLDLSIPCGLIVNEIISNALKYAFPNEREGEIHISLKKKGDKLFLSIGDNGIGLPKELDFRNTESLGLQLVVTLVEQLNGEIEVDLSSGTNFLINFTYNITKN